MKRINQTMKLLVRMLALVLIVRLALSNGVAGGCDCRMKSISLSASWWKIGFVNPGWPTNPPEIFLQRIKQSNRTEDYTVIGWGGADKSTHINGRYSKLICETYDVDHHYDILEQSEMQGEVNNDYPFKIEESYSKINGAFVDLNEADPNMSMGFSIIQRDTGPLMNAMADYTPLFNNTCRYTETTCEEGSQSDWAYSKNVFNYAISDTGHFNDVTLTGYNTPFTDALLAEKITSLMDDQGWPTNWAVNDRVMAYYFYGDTNHISAGGKMSFYRVEVPDSQKNVTYNLQWQLITVLVANNSTNTTTQTLGCQIIGTGDKVNPAIYDPPFFVDMPSSGNTTISITPPVIVQQPVTPPGTDY